MPCGGRVYGACAVCARSPVPLVSLGSSEEVNVASLCVCAIAAKLVSTYVFHMITYVNICGHFARADNT